MKKLTKLWLPFISILLCMLLALTLSSCSAGNDAYVGEAPNMGTEIGKGDGFNDASLTVDSSQVTERKVIKTYNVSAETKNYDQATKTLNDLIVANGGYVESARENNQSMNNLSDTYTRYASYTIRIPAEKTDAFMNSVGDTMHIISNQSTVDDISETYYSIEARLEELKVERDSLLDIMNQEETKKNYSFWLTINQRLSEVRQQIAVYQGQLNRFDGQVAYSTIHLSINEVLTYSAAQGENGFWGSLWDAFVEGWTEFFLFLRGLLIFLVGGMPFFLTVGVFAAVVVLICVLNQKREAKRRLARIKAEARIKAMAEAESQK